MSARRRPPPRRPDPRPAGDPRANVPLEIICVDCGSTAHLLSHVPEDGFVEGDVVAYRCEDCLDRWDLVVAEEDVAG